MRQDDGWDRAMEEEAIRRGKEAHPHPTPDLNAAERDALALAAAATDVAVARVERAALDGRLQAADARLKRAQEDYATALRKVMERAGH